MNASSLTLPDNPMFALVTQRLREFGVDAAWPPVEHYDRLLGETPVTTAAGRAIQFVAPQHIDDALSYEQRIHETGIVATRERNWHDLFNALVWATFPRTKAALNARHAAAQAVHSGGNRGRTQDALTLFDESGVIVASEDPTLLDALRAMRWRELFWRRRSEVLTRMRFVLFGHGLYEQARQPFIGLTGKALLLNVHRAEIELPATSLARVLDVRAAELFAATTDALSPALLHPLPILGVPGWWADNEQAAFYDNARYFRSRRARVS